MSEPERLLYRSNLLGSDLRITNFGGGNTSAKVAQKDPLTGQDVERALGQGLGRRPRVDEARRLRDAVPRQARVAEAASTAASPHEDEMVGYLPHCTFDLNPRAASIDTPLHAFIPKAHVDHMHPDAVIAIAASRDSEALTREVFGGEIGWLPWQRPGFDLGLKLGALRESNPALAGIVLAGHGLFTWGDTSKECYQTTLRIIQKAADYLAAKGEGRAVRDGRWRSRSTRPRKARVPRRARAGAAREALEGRAQADALHGRARGDGVRERRAGRGAGRDRHLVPRPLPAHARSGRSSCRSTRRRRRRATSSARLDAPARGLPRALRGLLRALQARRARRRCATRTR